MPSDDADRLDGGREQDAAFDAAERADRLLIPIDACDPGDEPICLAQIKRGSMPSAIIEAAARAVPMPVTMPSTLLSGL